MNTTTPLQSLALYNNDFMPTPRLNTTTPLTSPSGFEKAAGPNLKEQINQAFRIVFNRPPNEEEMELMQWDLL